MYKFPWYKPADNAVTTIICVQDTSLMDKRLRMLADEVIDLNGWFSFLCQTYLTGKGDWRH